MANANSEIIEILVKGREQAEKELLATTKKLKEVVIAIDKATLNTRLLEKSNKDIEKSYERVGKKVESFKDALQSYFTLFLDNLKKTKESFTFNGFIQGLDKTKNALMDFLKNSITVFQVAEYAYRGFESVVTNPALLDTWTAFQENAILMTERRTMRFSTMLANYKTTLQTALNPDKPQGRKEVSLWEKTGIPKALDDLKTKLDKGIKDLREQLKNLPAKIKTALNDLPTYLSNQLKNSKEFLGNGIEKLKKELETRFPVFQSKLQSFLDKSKLQLNNWRKETENLLAKINLDTITNKLKTTFAAIADKIKPELNKGKEALKQGIASVEAIFVKLGLEKVVDKIKTTFTGLSSQIKTGLDKSKLFIENWRSYLDTVISDFKSGKTLDSLVSFFKKLPEKINIYLDKSKGVLKNWKVSIEGLMEKVGVGTAYAKLQDFFKNQSEKIKPYLDKSKTVLKTWKLTIEEILREMGLGGVYAQVTSFFGALGEKIKIPLDKSKGVLKNWKASIEGLIEKVGLGTAYTKLQDFFKGLPESLKPYLDKSKGVLKNWKASIEGLIEKVGLGTAYTKLQDLFKSLPESIKLYLEKSKGVLKNWKASIEDLLSKVNLEKFFAAIQSFFSRLLNRIKLNTDGAKTLASRYVNNLAEPVNKKQSNKELPQKANYATEDLEDSIIPRGIPLNTISRATSQASSQSTTEITRWRSSVEKVLAQVGLGEVSNKINTNLGVLSTRLKPGLEKSKIAIESWKASVEDSLGRLKIENVASRLSSSLSLIGEKVKPGLDKSKKAIEQWALSTEALIYKWGLGDDYAQIRANLSKLNARIQLGLYEIKFVIEKWRLDVRHQILKATEVINNFADRIKGGIGKSKEVLQGWKNALEDQVGKVATVFSRMSDRVQLELYRSKDVIAAWKISFENTLLGLKGKTFEEKLKYITGVIGETLKTGLENSKKIINNWALSAESLIYKWGLGDSYTQIKANLAKLSTRIQLGLNESKIAIEAWRSDLRHKLIKAAETFNGFGDRIKLGLDKSRVIVENWRSSLETILLGLNRQNISDKLSSALSSMGNKIKPGLDATKKVLSDWALSAEGLIYKWGFGDDYAKVKANLSKLSIRVQLGLNESKIVIEKWRLDIRYQMLRAAEVFNGFSDRIKLGLDKSQELIQKWRLSLEGLINKSGIPQLANKIQTAAKDLGEKLKPGLDRGRELLESFYGKYLKTLAPKVTEASGAIQSAFQGIFSTISSKAKNLNLDTAFSGAFKNLGSALGDLGSFVENANWSSISKKISQKLETHLMPVFEKFNKQVVRRVDEAYDQLARIGDALGRLPNTLSNTADGFTAMAFKAGGLENGLKIVNSVKQSVSALSQSIGVVSQQVFFFSNALSTLQQFTANGPFKMLIGQNIQLKEKILETQTMLVSTNQILKDGVKIDDPKEAIQSLSAPIQSAIAKIRRDSLELSGVTSQQLIQTFNLVAGQVSQLNIPAKINNPLNAAADLAIDFAGALGTIGLPLHQQSQEINSILMGTIDYNSVLAKRLQLTNATVNKLREQGKLYDYLRDKLAGFKAGNSLAAKEWAGVTSNIQEFFEVITQMGGESLLEPILNEFNKLFSVLMGEEAEKGQEKFWNGLVNEGVIYVQTIVEEISRIWQAVVDAGKAVAKVFGPTFLKVPLFIFKELASLVEIASNAIQVLVVALKPLVAILDVLIDSSVVADRAAIKVVVTLAIWTKTISLLYNAVRLFASLVPGLGIVFIALERGAFRSANQFHNLGKAIGDFTGTGKFEGMAAGALIAARNLEKLPGLASSIAMKVPLFGQALVKVLPSIASTTIAISTMAGGSAIAKKVLDGLIRTITTLTLMFISFFKSLDIAKSLPDVVSGLNLVEKAMKNMGSSADLVRMASKGLTQEFNNFVKGKVDHYKHITKLTAELAIAALIISEVLQRSRDWGDEIDKLTVKIESASAYIRSMGEATEATTEALGKRPTLDWIDEIIVAGDKIRSGTMEVYNLKDGFMAVGGAVSIVVDWFVKLVQILGAVLGGLGFLIKEFDVLAGPSGVLNNLGSKLGKGLSSIFNPSNWSSPKKLFQSITQGFSDALGSMKHQAVGMWEQILEVFNRKPPKTKAEEQIEEIKSAIKKGELGKAVEDQVKAIDEAIAKFETTGQAPTKEALEQMKEDNEDNIKLLEDQYEILKKGRAEKSPEGQELKLRIITLREAAKRFEELGEKIKIAQDPLARFNQELTKLEKELKKLNDKTKESEAVANADLMQQRINNAITDKELEKGKAQNAIKYGKERLENLKDNLKKAETAYNRLNAKEKALAEDGANKIREMRTQVAEQSVAIQEKELAERKRIMEEFYTKLQRKEEELQRKIDQAQAERTEDLKELRKQGRISDAEFKEEELKQQADSLKKQLKNETEALKELKKVRSAARRRGDRDEIREVEKRYEEQKTKVSKLQSERLDNELAREEAHRTKIEEVIQRAANNELLIAERAIKQETESQERLSVISTQAEVARLEALLQTRIKNKDQRLKLELDLEKARTAALDAEVSYRQAQLQYITNQELLITERAIKQKTDIQEKLGVVSARAEIRRLESLLQGEIRNKDKRLQLELELEKAKTALIDAEVSYRQAQFQRYLQKLNNEIEKTKQLAEKENLAFTLIEKSFERQKKLLEAKNSLIQATQNYMSAELDMIAQSERSEFRKRQLAETTAALKLRALAQQQSMERESLAMEERQLEIQQQRLVMQNKLAQMQAAAAVAQAQADLEIVRLDPRKTPAEVEAARLKVEAAKLGLESSQQEGAFLPQMFEAEWMGMDAKKQAMEMSQETARDQAMLEYANNIQNPGTRARVKREMGRRNLEELTGESDRADAYASLNSFNQNNRKEVFGNLGRGASPLDAFDPDRVGISGSRERELAYKQSEARYQGQFGRSQYPNTSGRSGVTPFDPDRLFQRKGAELGQTRLMTQNIEQAMRSGVEQGLKGTELRGGSTTYNIQLYQDGRVVTSKTGETQQSLNLARIIDTAKTLLK